jgi:hypothetical protein
MMRARVARTITLFTLASLIVAACGSGAATTAPVTQAPVTQAPTDVVPIPTDDAFPSFALPSIHGDADLESLLPSEIGGEPLLKLSMTGESFLASGFANEIAAVLTGLGKQPSDLSVAFGSNSMISIIAIKVAGAPSEAILGSFRTAYQQDTAATESTVSIAGKSVHKFQPDDPTDDPSYIYAKDDVVFSVLATGVSNAILDEVFTKLP